jgi:hypothetical protein
MTRDRNFDALPCDALPADGAPTPANVRFGPDLQAAWKALYGFLGIRCADGSAYEAGRQRSGPRWAPAITLVLDRAGFDTVSPIASSWDLSSPVLDFDGAMNDALLFPLDNSAGRRRAPIEDHSSQAIARGLVSALGVSSRPASLATT